MKAGTGCRVLQGVLAPAPPSMSHGADRQLEPGGAACKGRHTYKLRIYQAFMQCISSSCVMKVLKKCKTVNFFFVELVQINA